MQIKKFYEANIDLKELEKTSKSGDLRGDVLVRKMNDEDDFTFKPKGSISNKITKVSNPDEIVPNITDDGKYDPDKAKVFFKSGSRYKKVIKGENGQNYQLNDIEKNSEFGSSGGSSLGSKDTRIVECIQCLFLALRQIKGEESLTESSIDELFDGDEIITEVLNKVKLPININKETIENYSITWLKSFVNTANALFEIRPIYTQDKSRDDNALSRRKNYIFYQIGYKDGLTKLINDKYRSFSETTGIPIAKWTPSDIWAVQSTQYSIVISRISETKNINELNDLVDLLFDQKILRGVSLKKLKQIEKTSDVKLVLNKVTPVPKYEFEKVITSKNPLGSIGIRIIANQISEIESENKTEYMDLRSFSGPDSISDVSGEVIGESARHGKVGLSRINSSIQKISELKSKSLPIVLTKNDLEYWTDDKLKREIIRLNRLISKLGESIGNKQSVYLRSRMISKYQSLCFAEILYTYPEYANEIIQTIFYYAMSISNDKFTSPKYIRIV